MVKIGLMKQMRAPAKINLMLHVTGKRPDGYHTLNSLIVFTDLADDMVLESADALSLIVDGPFGGHAPADENNLVMRAVRVMEEAAGKKAALSIRLTKNVPAGAGMGGGSADAACVMRALNDMWGNPFSIMQLKALGLKLGAELPVCMSDHAQWVDGIGEHVIHATAPTFHGVVAWPAKVLSTASVFKAYHGSFTKPMHAPNDVVACRNDLQEAAIMVQPIIKTVIDFLDQAGAVWSRMTGSGSACFGVFESDAAAKKAAAEIAAAKPDWWVKPCKIN